MASESGSQSPKKIPLSQGRDAIVDEQDFGALSRYRWFFVGAGTGYAVRWARDAGGRRRLVYMHREILNAPPDKDVDHIDRDSLNNKRANIRVVARSLNNHNRRSWGRSRFKGVHWDARDNRWCATITLNGKNVKIGRFASEREAAMRYDERAREAYGEAAVTNF